MTKLMPPGNETIPSSRPGGVDVSRMEASKASKTLRTSGEGLVIFLLFMVATEVFLSISHIGEQEYLKVDPVIGFMHLENKRITDRTEAFAISQINSQGLNDYEHKMVKDPGSLRIAVLGDSIVEAMQVPIEQRFTSVLQRDLEQNTGKHIEVMNFGTGGFSTGQEYLQYIRDVRQYKPDLVLLVMHHGDEDENGPVKSKWSLRPTFALDSSFNPVVRWQEFDTWRQSRSADPLIFFDWGRRHSHIWQALLQIHDSVKNDSIFKRLYNYAASAADRVRAASTFIVPAWRQQQDTSIALKNEKLQADRANICREGALASDEGAQQVVYDESGQWRLELRLLSLFNSKCVSDHCKFVVAEFPAVEKSKAERDIFDRRLVLLQKFATQCGFQTIDLSPVITDAPGQKTSPLFLLAHLSPRGHELVAKTLAGYLAK